MDVLHRGARAELEPPAGVLHAPAEVDVPARADAFAEAADSFPRLPPHEQVRRRRVRALRRGEPRLVEDATGPCVAAQEPTLKGQPDDAPGDRPAIGRHGLVEVLVEDSLGGDAIGVEEQKPVRAHRLDADVPRVVRARHLVSQEHDRASRHPLVELFQDVAPRVVDEHDLVDVPTRNSGESGARLHGLLERPCKRTDDGDGTLPVDASAAIVAAHDRRTLPTRRSDVCAAVSGRREDQGDGLPRARSRGAGANGAARRR